MKKEKILTILLADDHKIIREGLRNLLEKDEGVKVVAEAKNGRETLKLCRKLAPHVVIMDISMPELNGIETTRKIVTECPGTKVIGLSVHTDRQFVKEILKAGASGYLVKDCSFHDVIAACHAVTNKQMYLSPKIASHVIQGYVNNSSKKRDGNSTMLSPREREVLQLLAEGKNRREIADMLNISPRTVESHRKHIMEKLDISNIAGLVKFAIREGFTSLEY